MINTANRFQIKYRIMTDYFDKADRVILCIALLLAGIVIGGQFAMRDARIEIKELKTKIECLERASLSEKTGIYNIPSKGE